MTIPDQVEQAILADLYVDVYSEDFEASRRGRVKHLLFELDVDGQVPWLSRTANAKS